MGNVPVKDLLRYAEDGNVEAVKKLAKHPESKLVADETGNSPLHCAAFQGHVEVVKALLRAGHNLNGTNLDGDTPLHLAALGKRQKVIKILTGTGKANLNATNTDGFTALHYCAGENHLSGSKHLLQECNPAADPRLTNLDGQTPLALAVSQGHVQMAGFLLSVDSSIVNIPDQDGETPLHAAVEMQRADLVGLLIHYKANMDVPGIREITPYQRAQQLDNTEVLEEFKKAFLGETSSTATTAIKKTFAAPPPPPATKPAPPQQPSPRKTHPGSMDQDNGQSQIDSSHYLSPARTQAPPHVSSPPTLGMNERSAPIPGTVMMTEKEMNERMMANALPPGGAYENSPRSPPQLLRVFQQPHPALVARQQVTAQRQSAPPPNGSSNAEDVARLHDEVAAMRADRLSHALRSSDLNSMHNAVDSPPPAQPVDMANGAARPLFYSRYSNPPRNTSSAAGRSPVISALASNVTAPPSSAGAPVRRIPQAMFSANARPGPDMTSSPPSVAGVHSRYTAYRSPNE